MDKYKNKYRISSNRARFWDYGSAGLYFITICTKDRTCWFGEIHNNEMMLTEIGGVVLKEWVKTFQIRTDMNLWMGDYVIMPNHFHAIIGIGKNEFNSVDDKNNRSKIDGNGNIGHGRDATHCVSTSGGNTDKWLKKYIPLQQNEPPKNKFGAQSKNVASIVRGFKSAVTKNARQINPEFSWQRLYHDYIIRDKKTLRSISTYIQNNPSNWKEDTHYPD